MVSEPLIPGVGMNLGVVAFVVAFALSQALLVCIVLLLVLFLPLMNHRFSETLPWRWRLLAATAL